MMKSSASIFIAAFLVLFSTGCGALVPILFGGATAAQRAGLFQSADDIEYSDELEDAEVIDPHFEQQLLDAVQDDEEDAIMEFRWTLISDDWFVDRETNDFGESEIVGRLRLIWVGGPVKEENLDEEQPRDCFFGLYQGYQQHMGGGNYGPTRFSQAVNWHPNVYRMRCETEEELRRATPPHYQTEDAASDSSSSDDETGDPEDASRDEEAGEPDTASSDEGE